MRCCRIFLAASLCVLFVAPSSSAGAAQQKRPLTRRTFAARAIWRTQLPQRHLVFRSDDVRVPFTTRRFQSRSSDVGWRFRGLSLGQTRPATRRIACVKAFRLEHGRRCRRTAPTGRTGLRSRFARQEWRAWFGAHRTAEPPTSPRSLHRTGTRLRWSVQAQYFQRTGGRKCAASAAQPTNGADAPIVLCHQVATARGSFGIVRQSAGRNLVDRRVPNRGKLRSCPPC
jgi:hypothetical protein